MEEFKKSIYDFTNDFNKTYAFLLGVDEVEFSPLEGIITCRFNKTSQRYVYIRYAESLIETFEQFGAKEGAPLLHPIKELIESMEGVINDANKLFNGKMVVKYDADTQKVIDKLKSLLKE